MKILIAQSYFRVLDPKELHRNMPYPPLGSLYIATILRNLGHEIKFFDSMLAESPLELENLIKEYVPDFLMVYDDEFNYLTKMCLSNMREAAFSIVKVVNKLGINSLIYSSDAMDHSNLYLNSGYDIVIFGEGEATVQEIIIKTSKNLDFTDIKGIRFLSENDLLIETEKRDLISNLDSLPNPDYSFVKISEYKRIWVKNHGYFSINISTSRGCPFSCNWCAKPLYGNNFHVFSPERVINHIIELQEKYKIDHIWFTDDIFGLKPSWLKNFSEELKKAKIRIPYKCLSRVDLLVKNNTISYLKDSGCEIIWTGVESGSQKILDAMDKGIKINEIDEATKLAHRAGIKIAYFLQFGYLSEDWDDIRQTRKMVRKNLPDDIGISVSYPLPNTKFYDLVKNDMVKKTNWKDSDDLDLMFSGLFHSNFYKLLHRFVHAEYNTYKILKKKKIKKFILLPNFLTSMIIYRIKMNSYLSKAKNKSNLLFDPIPVLK